MEKLSCVLLVDDDPTTNYLNRKLLERLAVTEQVLVAHHGQEALALLAAHCQPPHLTGCPTLILLDVNMPVMNGYEFLAAYQQLPAAQRQASVIVMLTTSLHPADVQRVELYGITTFLSKPLATAIINAVLKAHFGRELPGSQEGALG
ncbi:response regulator [Hymenobacter sp. YC55]|uniref:response regulator n=1 Tax=Hymenobacter sp. YC55 TaxID=3034019 RepID=UPI0023F6D489|nr:response regulator [Hymenobacter sp. YC55]MDF7815429.1 response regulator [Hymenobacter sp. YC55]